MVKLTLNATNTYANTERSQKSVVLLISMSLCCICMLCKKDQQQENRNIDDLPPLHDVEEPLNNDTG